MSYKPTQGMIEEAKRGLEWREEYGRGGTAVGIARARDIVNGKNLSRETVGRMASFFARHADNERAEGWSPGEPGYPSAGRIAWALWGGDAGRTWAEAIMAREELRTLRWGSDLEAEAAIRAAGVTLADGWILGRAFRCLSVGEIYQRVDASTVRGGEMRGRPITRDHLESIIALYESGEEIPINIEHERDKPQGTVAAAWLVDGGDSLAVLPAYGPSLAVWVAERDGAIWSSPELAWSTTHDPATGDPVGSMLMDGLALCSHPAQAHRKIDRVRLSAGASDTAPISTPEVTANSELEDESMEEMQAALAELQAALAAQGEAIAALNARLDAMEKPAEEKPESEEAEGEMGYGKDKEEMEQLSALKSEVAQLKQEKLAIENASAVRELLASGRITPAEQAAAEKVVKAGGRELLSTVYGGRQEGQAIPTLKGHSKAVETEAKSEWVQAREAARELMSSNPTLAFDDAFRAVVAERERQKLAK